MNYDMKKVHKVAMENTPRIYPAILSDIKDIIFGSMFDKDTTKDMFGELKEDNGGSGIFVLSNKSQHLGASALYYPGIKEKIAEILKGDYYVLPSSVHETIIVPKSEEVDMGELKRIVKNANKSVVEDGEILSERILFYDSKEKKLLSENTVCRDGDERSR